MSVLVTGGAGYIGSHTVLELLEADENVIVIDSLTTGFDWAVPPGAELVVGDIGDAAVIQSITRTHTVDAILHFAASIIVPDSVAHPLAYYHNNTVKSQALIEAAVCNGVKNFIFSSSAAVYGALTEIPVREDAAPRPISPYGSSKLMTEIMLADCARAYDLCYIALRYFNVAGADPNGRAGESTPRAIHLIKVACETALGKRTHMEVFGTDYPTPDGTCVRDFIHVSDLARAHVAALTHLRVGGRPDVFNCGSERGYSVLQVIEAVKRISGRDFEVRLSPRRPGDPPVLIAASDKIRQELRWMPQYDDLDVIIGHALRWEERLMATKEDIADLREDMIAQ